MRDLAAAGDSNSLWSFTTSTSVKESLVSNPFSVIGECARMLEAGLTRAKNEWIPTMDDERRIYYGLSGLRRTTLPAELERYRDVLPVAARSLRVRSAHGT